jgi:hypothetical protein
MAPPPFPSLRGRDDRQLVGGQDRGVGREVARDVDATGDSAVRVPRGDALAFTVVAAASSVKATESMLAGLLELSVYATLETT